MLGTIAHFIVSALVLLLIAYLLPGITVSGLGGALIAAVVIAVLGYIVESILGEKVSPRSRGIVGFITAVVVIYVAQFIVPIICPHHCWEVSWQLSWSGWWIPLFPLNFAE